MEILSEDYFGMCKDQKFECSFLFTIPVLVHLHLPASPISPFLHTCTLTSSSLSNLPLPAHMHTYIFQPLQSPPSCTHAHLHLPASPISPFLHTCTLTSMVLMHTCANFNVHMLHLEVSRFFFYRKYSLAFVYVKRGITPSPPLLLDYTHLFQPPLPLPPSPHAGVF